jgi:uncharacterized membrane protein YeaQ/YmgE (transglycosylase-associated protein family)
MSELRIGCIGATLAAVVMSVLHPFNDGTEHMLLILVSTVLGFVVTVAFRGGRKL